jgi:hypothetical protein
MDMTETMGTVWLGITLNCCRCHDHKFDSFSRRDYYSLFAFFNQTPVTGGGGNPQTPPVIEAPSETQRQRLAELDGAIASLTTALNRLEQSLLPRGTGESSDGSATASDLPDKLSDILKLPLAKRNADQWNELAKHWNQSRPEYSQAAQQMQASLRRRDALRREIPRVMIMQDMTKTRQTFMLDKGLYDKPGERVSAAVPGSLPALPEKVAANRLGLARWLVDPANPLTPRVTANRLWQQFFGAGLVKTPEDFGVQGQPPTHPQLLDWLAIELRDSGWDLKALCRLIVTSATYRQSSRLTPELHERDPENRMLARGPRYRLPAWMIRDQALAAADLLVRDVGGPPVKPYQPQGVWAEATFGKKRYQPDTGSDVYRRSLYTFWRRIVGPTMFFDSASRQTCSVKQARTNTPLHALSTLNDVTYLEAARVLAERLLTLSERSSAERLEHAFRRVVGRRPTEAEIDVLRSTLEDLREQFAADPPAATVLLSAGEAKRNKQISAVEHAAYTALCHALLNLDETVTKE